MCLDRISASHAQPSDLIVDAWKEFSGTRTAPKFENYNLGPVTLDAWIQAIDLSAPQGIYASDGQRYKPGFHAYADEKDKRSRYRRVYLRRITCEGYQDGKRAVVAQEMYVPSDENGWPPKAEPAPASPPPAPKPNLKDRLRRKMGGAS